MTDAERNSVWNDAISAAVWTLRFKAGGYRGAEHQHDGVYVGNVVESCATLVEALRRPDPPAEIKGSTATHPDVYEQVSAAMPHVRMND